MGVYTHVKPSKLHICPFSAMSNISKETVSENLPVSGRVFLQPQSGHKIGFPSDRGTQGWGGDLGGRQRGLLVCFQVLPRPVQGQVTELFLKT